MSLRNRIVMPAMDQNLCDDDGLLTEANIAHYETRAAGGVGLLILETSAVMYPVGATSRHQPALSSDDCVPGLRALAERVHAHGARLIVQACHHGKTSGIDTIDGRDQLVPTTPLPPMDMMGMAHGLTMDEMMKMAARFAGSKPGFVEATPDDLAAVVDAFGAAAARVAAAGCDGMEVHAAHGYLLSTFLSPHWNRRADEYGGTTEKRTRLLREVVAAIRAATSDDFCVVVRLDGAEFGIDGGITPELAAQHAVAAAAAGADAIHVSAMGAPDSGVAFTDGPLPWKPVQYRELTRAVKAAVSIPVVAVGRIEPGAGDRLVGEGEADFISMGRQLLADPNLPAKLIAGASELVRPCINCFVCVAENFWDATPICAVNAELGHPERTIEVAAEPRRVVIVGGGPAGMECARVAAERGHQVALLEATPHLGGTARFSSLTTPKNGELVRYLQAAVQAAGVNVRLRTPATTELVGAMKPDVIVVATGATRGKPDVPGIDLPHVLSGDDLRALLTGDDPEAAKRLGTVQRLALRAGQAVGFTDDLDRVRDLSKRWMPLGDRVTIIGGGLVGLELAEFLAERGRSVTVLEASPNLATEMAHPRRWRALHEATQHGVQLVADARPTLVTDRDVAYVDGDGIEHAVPSDHVIIASNVAADTSVADALADIGVPIHTIGDAAAVNYIEGAIASGYDCAIAI